MRQRNYLKKREETNCAHGRKKTHTRRKGHFCQRFCKRERKRERETKEQTRLKRTKSFLSDTRKRKKKLWRFFHLFSFFFDQPRRKRRDVTSVSGTNEGRESRRVGSRWSGGDRTDWRTHTHPSSSYFLPSWIPVSFTSLRFTDEAFVFSLN